MKQSKGLNDGLNSEHKKTTKQDHDEPDHRHRQSGADILNPHLHTVKPQWLEHPLDNENLFEIYDCVVPATHG